MYQNEPEFNSIFEFIKKTISSSCGIAEERIHIDATLFDELEIDSIDMVDILFILENEYNISLKISDIENESRIELGDEPFEVDGVITDIGLSILKKRMPEIDPSKLVSGVTVHEIARLITVHSMVNMVINQKKKQAETKA